MKKNATLWRTKIPIGFQLKLSVQNSSEQKLKNVITRSLQFSIFILLSCLNTLSVKAQIDPNCINSGIYYYDVNTGVMFSGNVTPGYDNTFSGGTAANGKTLASMVAGSKTPGTKLLGIDQYGITFLNPAGKAERYFNNSAINGAGAFFNTYETKLLPEKAVPASPPTKTTHAGEIVDKSNPNWVDIADFWAVLKDSDGSYSMYDYTTGKYIPGAIYDPTWTTYSGGDLNGKTISSLAKKDLAGFEFNLIFHVNPAGNGGAGILEFYNYHNGQFINNVYPVLGSTNPANGTLTGGALAGKTLNEAVGNGIGSNAGVPGITYLGINRNGSIYTMNFFDANANRVLLYDCTFGFPYNNTYTAFEPTSITPNALTPAPNITSLSDINTSKFVGVGFNELWFKDADGKYEAYQANLPTAPGLFESPCLSTWDGPQAGKMVMPRPDDPNYIGMTRFGANFGSYVFKDPDGSLSIYDGFGNLILGQDYCWTKYSGGGPLNGQPIEPSKILDVEYEGLTEVLYTIDNASTIHAYNAYTGVYMGPRTSALTAGPLAGKPLSGLTSNTVNGVEFLGIATNDLLGQVFLAFAVCNEDMKVTKAVTAITSGATPSVQYDITLENTGSLDLTQLTIVDNLATQMGCAFASVASTPTIVSPNTATTAPTINPTFNGSTNTNVLNGTTGLLKPGEKVTVRIIVNTNSGCSAAPFSNVAQGGGTGGGSPLVVASVPPTGATGLAACTTITTKSVGPDQVVCQDAGTVTLVPPTDMGAGTWSVVKGAGTVSGNVYTLSAGDYDDMNLVEVVELKWTPTNPPLCTVADLVTLVTVNHLPIVDAGSEVLSCGVAPVDLAKFGASIKNNASGVTNGTWTTSGDGTFTPNGIFSTATKYVPGATDIATGRVNLTLTSDDPAGPCGKVTDKVLLKIANTMSCVGKINIALTNNCDLTVTPEMLSSNAAAFPEDFKVQIMGKPNATFTKSDVGKCFKVKVTNLCGTSCWSEVCIEDKSAPVISCPRDLTMLCFQLGTANVPTPAQSGDLKLDNLTPTLPGSADGTATDCTMLMASDESYVDYIFETSCQTPYASGSITAATVNTRIKDLNNVSNAAPIVAQIDAIVGTGDVFKVIVRQWKAIDHYGNISLPCYQVIGVKRLPAIPATTTAPTLQFSCGAAVNKGGMCIFPALPSTGIPNPVVTVSGVNIDLVDGLAACNIDVKKMDDQVFDVCAGSKKIIRTWKIKDWCRGTESTVTQEVKILDMSKPVVRTTYTNFDRVKKTYCYVDAWGQTKTRDAFDVVASQGTLADFTGENLQCGFDDNGTTTTINALADANNCRKFNVKFDFLACDPNCTNDLVTLFSNNSNIRVTGGTKVTDANGGVSYKYTAEGSLSVDDAFLDETFTSVSECNQQPYCHDVTFTAKDKCGYAVAKQTFRIRLIDNVAPQAVCITSHTASVGTDGTVRVSAETFNNGSSDNCGIQMFMVRRMINATQFGTVSNTNGGCNGDSKVDNCYRDYVDFVCSDVDKTVMVEMLVVDQNCNINSCMVEVKVQNKQKPVCVAPAGTSITCKEVGSALTNLAQFGEASTFGNCGATIFEKAASSSVDNCGVGSITRSWGVKNCNGVEISGLAACTQVIRVTPIYDFRVNFPEDVELTCAGAMETRDQLKNRMLTTPWGSTETGADGSIRNDGCGVIVVSIEDETLMATTGTECMKTFRKICVYDWCVYQPNNNIDFRLMDQASGFPLTLRSDLFDRNSRSEFVYRDWTGGTAGTNGTNPADPNTFQFNHRDGYICHTQIIKVVDKTAPTLVAQADRTVCFDKGTCGGKLTATLVANDQCGTTTSSSLLTYSWTILTPASGKAGNALEVLTSGTGSSINYGTNLKAGVYTIRWTAKDQCGNEQLVVDEFTIELKDCEAPFLLVHEKVAELSYVIGQTSSGAMAEVFAVGDLLNNVSDNCTGYDFLVSKLTVQRASDPVVYPTAKSVMLNCADRPSVSLRVWTVDEAGNQNWVLTTVKVQANANQCSGPGVTALAGAVGTENGKAVKGTTISAKTNFVAEVNANTINDGSFITSIIRDQDYVVSASKVDASDKFLGVTTFDIAKISKHLLDIEKIGTPYSLIAADVDMNNEIDGADMLKIRNFILRKSDNLNTNGTIWRFVDKSYSFKNAASPLTEDFSTVVSLKKVGDRAVANFVAVKLGDVNTTYTGEAVATVRNAKTLNFTTEDIDLVAGNEYTVNIAAENFNAAAFQGTFSFTNATVKAAKGTLLTDANMAIFSNAITTSWNGNAKADDIMAITFVANKSGKLSEMLTINSSLTPAVANEANGTEMNVNLKFSNGKVAGGEFALNNATPNPVKFETVIGFNLPKDSKATLTVYTTEGKVLSVKNVDAKAGANQITLTKGDLNATGVMYYRLETADYSATKKMVVIE
jgi:hypothetical protein